MEPSRNAQELLARVEEAIQAITKPFAFEGRNTKADREMIRTQVFDTLREIIHERKPDRPTPGVCVQESTEPGQFYLEFFYPKTGKPMTVEELYRYIGLFPDDYEPGVIIEFTAPIELHCSVCGEPQFKTPSGMTCKNGHGGAPSDEVFVCDSCMPGGDGITLVGHLGDGVVCECFICGGSFERNEVNAITKARAEEIAQEKAASAGPVCPAGDEGVEGPPGPPDPAMICRKCGKESAIDGHVPAGGLVLRCPHCGNIQYVDDYIDGDKRPEMPGHPDGCYCPLCMAERGKRVRVTCSECEVEFNPNVDPNAAGFAGGPLCPECYKKKREKEADGEA